MRRTIAVLATVVAVAAGCGDDTSSPTTPTSSSSSTSTSTTSTSSSTTSTSTTSTSTTTTTTTTTVPEPVCDTAGPLAVVDESLAAARLPSPAEWTDATADAAFASRTTTGEEYAARVGLACGARFAADDGDQQWLAVVAWIDDRMAYAIQATAAPTVAYAPASFVRNPLTEAPGEFLADDMSRWATSGPDGESIVLGHVDFSLGAAAKDWDGAPRVPFEDEINLPAEQHAIDALTEAGMRNVNIAQPPERGSEEGYVQFVSRTGQISVVDVAPTGWFDPMVPRYFTGDTRTERIDGVEVRITLPEPGDSLGFAIASEVAFACDDYAWLLEPPFNGTEGEMLEVAAAVIATSTCRGS